MKRLALFATLLVAAGGTSLIAAQAPPPDLGPRLTRAADRIASINAQADRITDYDALRNLQQIYGYYFDEALWDQVIDLFADDATLEVAQNGVYAGKSNIRSYLYGLTGGKQGLTIGRLNNQFQLSGLITLSADGSVARARWRTLIQDGQFNVSANWGSGVYENTYVKQAGVWKIQSLHLYLRFFAPYAGGWTRTTAALNARYGVSTARATQPPSLRYQTYPALFTAPMHFDNPAHSNYRLAPENSAKAAAPVGPARTVTDLEAQVRALELKLERLRAVEDVENLESTYGYYADKSMQDPISALFAEHSTLEILGRGVFVGSGRVYEYMRRLGAPTYGTLFNHMQLQPVVHVSADGNTAQIRARLVVMFGQLNNSAQWAEGTYENRFVKENGVWKYQSLSGYQTFYSNYDLGWGKHSSAMLSYFPGYPPDLLQSVKYDPYPAVFVVPFHYTNPVSGR
jgi:SnoaL-like domain